MGVLSGSGGTAGTIELYASGAVDPRPLVAATVGLGDAAMVLGGDRREGWTPAPKIQVDPRILQGDRSASQPRTGIGASG